MFKNLLSVAGVSSAAPPDAAPAASETAPAAAEGAPAAEAASAVEAAPAAEAAPDTEPSEEAAVPASDVAVDTATAEVSGHLMHDAKMMMMSPDKEKAKNKEGEEEGEEEKAVADAKPEGEGEEEEGEGGEEEEKHTVAEVGDAAAPEVHIDVKPETDAEADAEAEAEVDAEAVAEAEAEAGAETPVPAEVSAQLDKHQAALVRMTALLERMEASLGGIEAVSKTALVSATNAHDKAAELSAKLGRIPVTEHDLAKTAVDASMLAAKELVYDLNERLESSVNAALKQHLLEGMKDVAETFVRRTLTESFSDAVKVSLAFLKEDQQNTMAQAEAKLRDHLEEIAVAKKRNGVKA